MILQRALRNSVEYRDLDWGNMADWVKQVFAGGEDISAGLGTAERLSPLAAAHRILTGAMSVIPMGLYRKKDGVREPMRDDALDWVLKIQANDRMTPSVVKGVLMSQCFWYGRAHLWPMRDPAGNVRQLIPLMTPDVSIRKDPETGMIWYDCTVDNHRRIFASSELITVYFETYDGLRGRGVLDLAKEAIAADAAAQRYNRKFLSNGAKMSGVVSVDTHLEEPGRDRIKSAFRSFAGGDEAFGVAVLDRGMTYTPIGVTQADAQFLEGRTFSVAEVSRFTGVPEPMLQSGKQSYNSNAQQMQSFVTNTLMPHVVRWEQEFGLKLLDRRRLLDGWYCHSNLAALLRGDDEARAKFYQLMVYCGLLSPDECRALEERNPIPDGLGQKFYMTKNLAPLDQILSDPTP